MIQNSKERKLIRLLVGWRMLFIGELIITEADPQIRTELLGTN